MPQQSRPLRIAIVNDYDLIVAGVATMLGPYQDRVVVVETDTGLPVASEVHIVLYDTFAQVGGDGIGLGDLVRPGGPRVVVYSWAAQPASVEVALAQGAAGFLTKDLPAAELVAALETIHDGTLVVTVAARRSSGPLITGSVRRPHRTLSEAEHEQS